MSGQSIVDRLNAAKHTVAGSALGRAVVKATTEEVMAPKRKHLEYLLSATSEINVSIPQMADLLIERTQNTSWVVTFKSLITIHNLMCFGNERFSQYMASHNSKFLLNNFLDKSGVQGVDMSSYIRKYAQYLNEKRETYKLMGFDFCKVKRGKDDGMLRTMNTEKLIKTLPILHQQLEALLHFDVQPNELTNSVINACFVLLSKDLIRLFACYNDGVINLLEKFFEMNKKNCREALDIYKRFLDCTDKVSAFLKVAENAGMDKGDIPDLTKAPSSLLEALEAHVGTLENKKTQSNGQSTSATSTTSTANGYKTPSSVTNAINSLSSNVSLSAEEKRKVIEEEAKTLESFKSPIGNSSNFSNEANHLKKQTSLSSPTNEFSQSFNSNNSNNHNNNNNSHVEDLFNIDFSKTTHQQQFTTPNNVQNKASDDLLMLTTTTTSNPFMQQSQPQQQQQQINPFGMNGGTNTNNLFAFQSQIPNHNPQPENLFSGLTFSSMNTTTPSTDSTQQTNEISQIISTSSNNNIDSTNTTNATKTTTTSFAFSDFDAFGDVLQPMNVNNSMKPQTPVNDMNSKLANDKKLLSTDIDSSLASLADHLDINYKNKGLQKNHQWTPDQQQGQLKTGGNDWKPMKTTANATNTFTSAPIMAPVTMQSQMWNPMVTNVGMTSMVSNVSVAQTNWNNPFAAPAVTTMQQPMLMPVQTQIPMRPMQAPTNPFGF